jgi:hypothetical protein
MSCIRLCIGSELAYDEHAALYAARGLQIGVDNLFSSVNNLKSTTNNTATNNSATNIRASNEVSRITTDSSGVAGSRTHPKPKAAPDLWDDSQQHSHFTYA